MRLGAEERRLALGLDVADDCLVVSVVQQTLDHYRQGRHRRTYRVSTARAGTGCVADSLRTPTGLHRVSEHIGGDAPLGMVFKARVATGVLASDWPRPEDNLITSRILRLDGAEPGHNRGRDAQGRLVDSRERFIYIHGTNQAAEIGRPNSHGCVLLDDASVAALYADVPDGAWVYIG